MDLTFAEFLAQLPEGTVYQVQDNNGYFGLNISVSSLFGVETTEVSSTGVIKLFNKLLGAAYKAQVEHNKTASPEELLESFSAPIGNAIDSEGYLIQTQSVVSRLYTASASDITGYQRPPEPPILAD